MSKIEEAVAKKLLDRAKVGEDKYGTTMERNDLSLMEWLIHLQEELMDAAVYVEKLKQEVQYQEYELRGPCSMHDEVSEEEIMAELDSPIEGSIAADLEEIKREERMKIIGQNGNTGEHYDSVEVAIPNETPCGWDNTKKDEDINNIDVVATQLRTSNRIIYPDAIHTIHWETTIS